MAEVKITDLHDAILRGISKAFPSLVTVTAYDRIRGKMAVPAGFAVSCRNGENGRCRDGATLPLSAVLTCFWFWMPLWMGSVKGACGSWQGI